MATFSYDHPLPSLHLTKELLETLERYLTQQVALACSLESEVARTCFSVSIDDNLGTEKFASVKEFHPSRFSDSTKRVTVEIDAPWRPNSPRVRVRLQLSPGRLFSTTVISAEAPSPRELVLGLREGIARVLEPHKTWHWLCYPTAAVWGTLMAAFTIAVVTLWQRADTNVLSPYALAVIFAFCLYYLQFLTNLRPYVSFESRASERSDKVWSWFLGGLMTFLLFGTLFTMARRGLLGF